MQNKTPEGKEKSMPTTEQELEKYGVWVKAEPQDIIEEPETEHELLDDLDSMELTIEEPEPAKEETFFSEAEENALDSLDELPKLEEDSIIDIPLDDLDYENASGSAPAVSAKPVSKPEAPSADDMTLTEMSLDDFDMGEFDTSPPPMAEEKKQPNETESLDLSEFGLEDEDSSSDSAASATDDFETIDIDLQFDDTIPSVADTASETDVEFNLDDVEDMNSAGGDIFVESGSFDSSQAPGVSADSDSDSVHEDVTLDFSGSDKSVRKPLAAAAARLHETSIKTGVDSFIDADQNEESFMPTIDISAAESKGAAKKGFDDLQAVEKDLAGESPEMPSVDISSSMLEQIARELSSIKQELVSLRSQLKEIKEEPRAPAMAPEAAETSSPIAEEAPAGGFFDEEDDETIALTGAELDNIFNTADFIEESADDIQAEVAPEETVSLDTELLPEDGDYLKSSPGIETINLPEEQLHEESLEVEDKLESFDIEDDLSPISPAPEDTSYLEAGNEEEFPHDELVMEDVSLEDVPLMEPDLSQIDLDEELPLIELSSDNETEEPSSDDIIEEIVIDEHEDDLVLSIDGEEPVLDSSAEADFSSIPEIEEPEEIQFEDEDVNSDLHTEDFDGMPSEASTIKPAVPVQIHPDQLSMSLDDSLFVEQGSSKKVENEAAFEAGDSFDFPEIVEMDSGMASLDEPVEEIVEEIPAAVAETSEPVALPNPDEVPDKLKHDIKSVLLYLDQLLSALPEEKIEEFAASEYYDTYKNLFEELGIL